LKKESKKPKVGERIYLTFPKELVKEPIICLLAKNFDIVFTIRGSTVTAEMGLVALEISGERKEVDKAIRWLKEKGVVVEPIEKNVIE
jgi:ABC-type methionine transport system ATPase subunit